MVLACSAAALVAAQASLIWLTHGLIHATATTIPSVLPLILGLALPTALLLLGAPRLARLQPSTGALVVVFAGGLALRAVWFGSPAPLEDDFQRYLWDGAVVAHGLDPYRHAPERFLGANVIPPGYESVAAAGRGTIEGIYFPDLRTIYPSTAQLSFALAHLIAPFAIDGLRLVFLAAEVATFLLLVVLLVDIKASPLWSVLYWWNPTVAFALIGIAHVDALIPPFVLGAVLVAGRGWPLAAGALMGAGAGVKIWPVLLLPLALMRMPRSVAQFAPGALLLTAIVALAVGPVVLSASAPHSGLAAYAASWGNNNAFFAWTVYALGSLVGGEIAQRSLRIASALLVASIALRLAFRSKSTTEGMARAGLIVAAGVFYLSPAQFPWYAAWFLPLAGLLRSWPLMLASATLPAYYLFYPLWATGRGSVFFFGAAFLHSVPVLGWLAVDWLRDRRASRLPGGVGTS